MNVFDMSYDEIMNFGKVIKELDYYEGSKFIGTVLVVEVDNEYYFLDKMNYSYEDYRYKMSIQHLGNDKAQAVKQYIETMGLDDPERNYIEVVGYSEESFNTKYFIKH